jgi:hypothetical protein
MTFPKLLALIAIFLFGAIAFAAITKEEKKTLTSKETTQAVIATSLETPIEVELAHEIRVVAPAEKKSEPVAAVEPIVAKLEERAKTDVKEKLPVEEKPKALPVEEPPEANRIEEFFTKTSSRLPIVETITYKSRVDWQKGRPAWLSDYATHYKTSRHFIARSLNGKADYDKQDVKDGDRFNVLRSDKNYNFHLLIDTSRCKMWFYYHDLDTNERVLLKTYRVGLGRPDSSKLSGLLTPIGKYTLGNKIAIYKPKIMGHYNGQKTEMMRVFGTRWIPFEKEISGCSAPAKGFGIHGVPWSPNSKDELVEDRSSIGKHESDGCVRLASRDMEELFAIIVTKPTTVELVKDFYEAKLPGVEKK